MISPAPGCVKRIFIGLPCRMVAVVLFLGMFQPGCDPSHAQDSDSYSLPNVSSLSPATPATVLPSTYYGRKRNLTYDPFRRSATGRILNEELEDSLTGSSSNSRIDTAAEDSSIYLGLPERRESRPPAPSLSMTQPGAPISLDPMGWNGLMPLAPGSQLLPVPSIKTGGQTPALQAPAPILPSQSDLQSRTLSTKTKGSQAEKLDPSRLSETSSTVLKSRGENLTDEAGHSTPQAKTTRKKKLKKGDKEEPVEEPSALLMQPVEPVASRAAGEKLRSQSLSSSAGVSNLSTGKSGSAAQFTSPFGGTIAKPPQLPSRRFHGGNPGEARRPDYTYQFQGPRRYSVGETEYGSGTSYESLPYYRRKR